MSIKALIESHKQFREKDGAKYADLFKDLVENGQHPKTLFITCSDSRISPNIITNTGPGDLFIARNIGNFVPPFSMEAEASATPAAIEYAVSVLKVENIVVCGHTHCGACKSLHQDIPNDPEMVNVNRWLEFGQSVKNQAIDQVGKSDPDALYAATEKINIVEQMENLLTYPAIKRRVDENDLYIFGWYYQLEDGSMEVYNEDDKSFEKI